jgi:hypothetical protein
MHLGCNITKCLEFDEYMDLFVNISIDNVHVGHKPLFNDVLSFYSYSSTSISPFDCPLMCPAPRPLGTDASLSIICLETATMLSSMSSWPMSSMSGTY